MAVDEDVVEEDEVADEVADGVEEGEVEDVTLGGVEVDGGPLVTELVCVDEAVFDEVFDELFEELFAVPPELVCIDEAELVALTEFPDIGCFVSYMLPRVW